MSENGYLKKQTLKKQNPHEGRHPYGERPKKYRKFLNKVRRRLFKAFSINQEL